MNLIIRNMELPRNCAECDILHDTEGAVWCPFISDLLEWEDIAEAKTRPESCPLEVQYPPIDSKLMKSSTTDHLIYNRRWLYDHLEQEFGILKEVRNFEEKREGEEG